MTKKGKKTTRRGRTGRVFPAEYSRMLDVPRSTISRALVSGLIVAESDGRIDPKRRTNADYARDTEVRLCERRAMKYVKPDGRRMTREEIAINFRNLPAIDIEASLEKMPAPRTLTQLKRFTEIQKLALDLTARLGELIPRSMVEEQLEIMTSNINMFDVIAEAVAGQICARLNRPDHVETVKAIIAPEVKKIIEDFKTLCQKKI